MAPKTAVLEAALVDAAREVYRTEGDNLTVNGVRKHAEEKLRLEDGFFKTDFWKTKSKEIISTTATELMNNEQDVPVEDNGQESVDIQPKKTTKRQKIAPKKITSKKDRDSVTNQPSKQPRKRKLARMNTPIGEGGEEEGSNCAESGNSTGAENPEEDYDGELSDGHKKAKTRNTNKNVAESRARVPSVHSDEGLVAEHSKEHFVKPHELAAVGVNADESDGSSTSVLADTPPPKRKGKPSKAVAGSTSKTSNRKQALAPPSSPDEAEIKKLQGQLVKCGVRKIWGFELKQYGNDTKAKIRHLKSMLRDVGIEGRFSESRAREIKERRELMADLEEVQQMNRTWGHNGNGRASRSRPVKSLKESVNSSEGEYVAGIEEGDALKDGEGGGTRGKIKESNGLAGGEDEEDDIPTVKARSRQSARQDLAFLGLDSESDSD